VRTQQDKKGKELKSIINVDTELLQHLSMKTR